MKAARLKPIKARIKRPEMVESLTRLARGLGPSARLPRTRELSKALGVTLATLDQGQLDLRAVDFPFATDAPATPAAPAKYGYFLFLRWIRVFFSSLRCFFFAIRLRRFLMTEPIRPPSLRHNGRRARHHSPAAGRLGTRPKYREKRERQPLTQSSSLLATAQR